MSIGTALLLPEPRLRAEQREGLPLAHRDDLPVVAPVSLQPRAARAHLAWRIEEAYNNQRLALEEAERLSARLALFSPEAQRSLGRPSKAWRKQLEQTRQAEAAALEPYALALARATLWERPLSAWLHGFYAPSLPLPAAGKSRLSMCYARYSPRYQEDPPAALVAPDQLLWVSCSRLTGSLRPLRLPAYAVLSDTVTL